VSGEPGEGRRRELSRWLDAIVLPFVREALLWPVLVVLVLHAVAFVVVLLVHGLRDGGGWSRIGLVVSVAVSLGALHLERAARGRFQVLSAIVLVSWLLSIASAWLAARHGWL